MQQHSVQEEDGRLLQRLVQVFGGLGFGVWSLWFGVLVWAFVLGFRVFKEGGYGV